jgi:hypothetical protein
MKRLIGDPKVEASSSAGRRRATPDHPLLLLPLIFVELFLTETAAAAAARARAGDPGSAAFGSADGSGGLHYIDIKLIELTQVDVAEVENIRIHGPVPFLL